MASPQLDVYLPPSMAYFTKRLASGMTLNTIKVTNLSNTTAACGDTLRVRFPNNAIIDMSSFTMYALATTSGNYTVLPKLTQSLIAQVRININGQTICGGSLNDYGVLYNIGQRCQQDYSKTKMLEIIHSGLDVQVPTAVTSEQIAVDDWFGFLGALPHFIHTGMIGEFIIEIVLASNLVLPASTKSVASALALSNIYFTIQQLQFDSDIYSKMIETRLLSGDTLEIAYNDAYSFFRPASKTIEAQVSARAITKVFVVPRVNATTRTYTSTNFPVLGVGQYHLFDIGYGIDACDATLAAEDTAADLYVDGFHTETNSMQWSVDNRLIPANPATMTECYQMLIDCFGDRASTMASNSLLQQPYVPVTWSTVFPIPASGATARHVIIGTGATVSAGAEYTITNATTMAEAFPSNMYIQRYLPPEYIFMRKNCIFALNLELNESGDQRLISGFDSIGKNCVIRCDLTGVIKGATLSANVDLLMFVLVKKVLKIRAGQQIMVDI